MDVVSACPLRVASILWQPRPDAFVLTVVCKATFRLLPLDSPLSQEQDEPNDTDSYWDDDEQRSLSVASDLAPFKLRGDILLVGHAYAPKEKPVASLIARLTVGELTKCIEVHADRAWTADGQLKEDAPFVRMPLRWERAAGGPGTENPVGVSARTPPNAHGLRAIPNLQPPGLHIAGPADIIPPIGFGPIAPIWPGRVEKLRKYAGGWNHWTWYQKPLPEDIDGGFFNAAPRDQQVDQIRGDEQIVLENLLPTFPRLTTTLRVGPPRIVVQRPSAGEQELRPRCDTLILDTDRGTCALVWRAAAPLQRPDEAGRVVVSAGNPEQSGFGDDGSSTIIVRGSAPRGGATAPVLPFVTDSTGAAPKPSRNEVGASPTPAAAPRDDISGTIIVRAAPARDPLPFARSQERPTTGAPPSSAQALAPVSASTSSEPAAPPARVPSPPQGILPIVETPAVLGATSSEQEQQSPLPPKPALLGTQGREAQAIEKGEGHPADSMQPPPMLGPLTGMSAPTHAEQNVAQGTNGAARPPEAPDGAQQLERAPYRDRGPERVPEPENAGERGREPEPEPEPAMALDVAEYSIERYAAISAEIAEQREPQVEVLKRHGLTPRSWERLESHFTELLEKELERGAGDLRIAADNSYVATVEGFRGPISLPEYARILVGLERGQANQSLDELKIQRPALMPILRLWTRKLAGDLRLAGELTSAVAATRNKKR